MLKCRQTFTVNLTVYSKKLCIDDLQMATGHFTLYHQSCSWMQEGQFHQFGKCLSVPLCSSCLPRLHGCLSVSHLYLTHLQPPSHKLFLASAPGHFVLIRVYRPGLKKHHLNIYLRFSLLHRSFIKPVLKLSLYYCLDCHSITLFNNSV